MFALPNPDYETHPFYRLKLEEVDDALRREALAKFIPHFEACYQRRLSEPKLNYDGRIGHGDELLRQIQQTGCAVKQIAPERKAALAALTQPVAQWVHKKLGQRDEPRFKDTQFVFNRVEHPKVFEAVERIFEEEHVYAAASAYAGRPVVLKEITVQVNTDRTTALQYGPLDEDGLPTPRTRYMHIDSALWPPVKVLIFLNDVTADNGPFRYVEGSHRLAGDFELMVRKVNDREEIHDSLFMALPAPFRMYTLFGDFIDPDGEPAQKLLARERAYCDGVNDLILFDFNGVHRGGFVREGRRYMVQCHFERGGKVKRRNSSVLGVEQEGAG
ncbi:MAG TPA: phytanoyl-CoA dioxygenase family protein [Caulobacteraceae bacterium]